MSYEIFYKSKIGTVKTLSLSNGLIKFIKSGSHEWLVELAMKNSNPFVFTRFTTVITEIEASCLYDTCLK